MRKQRNFIHGIFFSSMVHFFPVKKKTFTSLIILVAIMLQNSSINKLESPTIIHLSRHSNKHIYYVEKRS